jgi:hypothetical protein
MAMSAGLRHLPPTGKAEESPHEHHWRKGGNAKATSKLGNAKAAQPVHWFCRQVVAAHRTWRIPQ